MTDELFLGIIWSLLLAAALLSFIFFFAKPKNYEWRKNIRARKAWAKMLEDK